MHIQKASINPKFINSNAILPYNLTVQELVKGIDETYNLLYELNNFLVSKQLDRLEDLLLGNSLSGIVSEFLVKGISNNSKSLVRNEKIGGHPDLIPRNKYPNNQILKGKEGIEVKTSKQRGGWQGHNPESIWLIVFRYSLDIDKTKPPNLREPITFIQVLGTKLEMDDWSFSGRSETSRRTITASITEKGMDKLRRNPIYQNPAFIVAPNKNLYPEYSINEESGLK